MPTDEPVGRLSGDALLDAVTDAMVALHLEHHDRVPTTARTMRLGQDLLACTLAGPVTDRREKRVDRKDHRVQEDRDASLQDACISAVEALSGRSVSAFVSSYRDGPGTVVGLFMFGRGSV